MLPVQQPEAEAQSGEAAEGRSDGEGTGEGGAESRGEGVPRGEAPADEDQRRENRRAPGARRLSCAASSRASARDCFRAAREGELEDESQGEGPSPPSAPAQASPPQRACSSE